MIVMKGTGGRQRPQAERMKVLPPTMRKKHRYVSFCVISEEPLQFADLEAAVWNTALDFHGETGVSRMDMWLVKNTWDQKKQSCVIRCERSSVTAVLSFLGIITRLGDNRATIDVQKVSGSVKGLGVRADDRE